MPCTYQRAIIGPGGERIQALSDQYGVSIKFPPFTLQSEYATVHAKGRYSDCQEAIKELRKRVKEQQDVEIARSRDLPPHSETIQIPSEYHLHLVDGGWITKIRERHDVDIQFHYKEDANHLRQIVIVGPAHRTRGKAIAKVQKRFNVTVMFPSDKESHIVTVHGMRKNVEDAINHLHTLEMYLLIMKEDLEPKAAGSPC